MPYFKMVETMNSCKRGMNLVTMTIINPRKGYYPSQGSNQRSPVPKFGTLPTELHWLGTACHKSSDELYQNPDF